PVVVVGALEAVEAVVDGVAVPDEQLAAITATPSSRAPDREDSAMRLLFPMLHSPLTDRTDRIVSMRSVTALAVHSPRERIRSHPRPDGAYGKGAGTALGQRRHGQRVVRGWSDDG